MAIIRLMFRWGLVASAGLLVHTQAFGQGLPALTVERTLYPPKIDGELSDPCWQVAAKADQFTLYNQPGYALARTEAFACYDDHALYVAFRCFPADDSAAAPPAPDDHVALYLSSGTDGRSYCRFTVTARNARQNQWNQIHPRKVNDAWEPDWRSAVQAGATAWTVEMALPWYNFAADLDSNRWRINFGRSCVLPDLEFSSWAAISGDYGNSSRYGILALPGKDFAPLYGLKVEDLSVPSFSSEAGVYAYVVKGRLRNQRQTPRRLLVEAEDILSGGPASNRVKIPVNVEPSSVTPFEVKLLIPRLGERRANIRVYDLETVEKPPDLKAAATLKPPEGKPPESNQAPGDQILRAYKTPKKSKPAAESKSKGKDRRSRAPARASRTAEVEQARSVPVAPTSVRPPVPAAPTEPDPVYLATVVPEIFPQLMKVYFDRTYYTVERKARLVARLALPPSAARFQARLEICPEEEDPIVIQAPLPCPERIEIELPLSRLPLGSHPASFAILDMQNNLVVREELELRIHEPAPPPVHEVKADRERMIALVDGKPFFPICLYGVPPEQMAVVKKAGFNSTIFWGGQGGAARDISEDDTDESSQEAFCRYLDAADEVGLKVIEWPPNYARDGLQYDDPMFPRYVVKFIETRLPQVIKAQCRHPALLAYYSLDEPGGDYLRRVVATVSRQIRELDPYHPNYVLFCVGIEEWPESIDIAGLDWYPRFGQDRVIKCLEGARLAVATARRLRVPEWHVPLCAIASASVRGSITGPEQRAQTYLALIGGVNGILWWVWPPRYTENWLELQKLARELNAMLPALVTAIPEQKMAYRTPALDDTVQAAVRVADNGQVYLITCNASPRPVQADITLDGRFEGPAEVLFENRQVPLKDRTVTDRFAGYGTHVYRMNGQWTEGGTLALAVASEKIESRPAESGKPETFTRENLIVDGGFEGRSYWALGGGSPGTAGQPDGYNTDVVHGGKQSAMLESDQDRNRLTWSGWTLQLEPRTVYRVVCYGGAELAGGGEAGFFLQGPYPQGQFVREESTLKFNDRAPDWERYVARVVTRDEPLLVSPAFYLSGRGKAWCDDVFVVPVSEPGGGINLLQNSGFEREDLPTWPQSWTSWANRAGMIGGSHACWGSDTNVFWEGQRSLRMVQSEWNAEIVAQGLMLDASQGKLHVEGGQPYVFSVYLKSDRPKTEVWLTIDYGNYQTVYAGPEWQRHVFVCSPDNTRDKDGFVRVVMRSAGTVWVDAAQLETGYVDTPYTPSE